MNKCGMAININWQQNNADCLKLKCTQK